MKIITLGTGHGDPTRSRFNSSTLLEVGERKYLIDAGAPAAALLIRRGIRIESLHGIFITHMHEDHFGGLSGILKHLVKYPPPFPVPVFLPEAAGETVFRQLLALSHRPLTEYAAVFRTIEAGKLFDDGVLRMEAIPTRHLENEGSGGFPSYAFLASSGNTRLVHTGDLKHDFSDFPTEACSGGTVCVCELTHYPWEKAEPVFRKLALKRLIFSHIGDFWQTEEGFAFWQKRIALLPYPATIAEDGDEFDLEEAKP